MKKVIGRLFFLISLFLSVLLTFHFFADSAQAQVKISSWSPLTSLPYELASHTSFVSNSKLFIIGGSHALGINHPVPVSAQINSDGTISSWNTEASSVPEGFIWHSTVVKSNYVYILGGIDNIPGSINSNAVYRGVIDSSSALGSWISVSSLPKRLVAGEAAIIGNKLYYAGGRDQFGTQNQQVYFADINPDGTLGTWSVAGILPYPLDGFSIIQTNNSVIILGGNTTSGFTANVWKSEVNPDGTLQIWIPLPSLPVPLYRAGVVKSGNVLVVIGGAGSGGQYLSSVYFAELDNNDDFASWQVSDNPLPRLNCCSPVATWNNHLYLTGGHDGGYYPDVLTAKVTTGTNINLHVPLLKQSSEPWQNNIYDSANIWNPTNPTINRWGCAITSIAMVLNYHGLVNLSSTTSLNPGSLNTWLKSQPDGYNRLGQVIWPAIGRLTRNIKAYNSEFSHEALEYKKSEIDDDLIIDDLTASRPVILNVPGHFIVAKGKDSSGFLINDPFYGRNSLSDGYNNAYLSTRRYIPSNTDLSYIYVVSNPDLTVEIRTSQNDTVGESYIEEPLMDPVDGNISRASLRINEYSQPITDSYAIHINADTSQSYNLDVYAYDINGQVKVLHASGNVEEELGKVLTLRFDKSNASSSALQNFITFSDFYQDINDAYTNRQINIITKIILVTAVKNIEIEYKRGRKTQALKEIEIFRRIITKLPKKDANQDVINMLLNNLDGLKNYILAS